MAIHRDHYSTLVDPLDLDKLCDDMRRLGFVFVTAIVDTWSEIICPVLKRPTWAARYCALFRRADAPEES